MGEGLAAAPPPPNLSLVCSQCGFEPSSLREHQQRLKLQPHLETSFDTSFHKSCPRVQEFRLISCHPPHSLLAGWRAAHSPRFRSQSIRGTSRLMTPAWSPEGQGGKSGEAPETGVLTSVLVGKSPERLT